MRDAENAGHKFEMRFVETNFSDCSDEYDLDPLDELSAFELGLVRFAHQHNYLISVRIGDQETIVELFRDIQRIVFDLPNDVSRFVAGKRLRLEFPELSESISFEPTEAGVVRCRVGINKTPVNATFLLEKSEVIRVVTDFLTELLRRAVQAEFITVNDAKAFLSPIAGLSESLGRESGN